MGFASFLVGIVGVFAVRLIQSTSKRRVQAGVLYIRDYPFPPGLFAKLRKKHPHLSQQDCELAGLALRQYFTVYLKSGRRFVAMPSQVTDDLWHEMILYTKIYKTFCRQAFGRFMHHTPAVMLGSARSSNAGLRRCWWYACLEEDINPSKPLALPLLFRLDEQLNIAEGFHYALDCRGLGNAQYQTAGTTVIHCGGDFASTDFDGTTDGFGDMTGSDGDGNDGCSGGCSGGCGGD